MTERIVIKNLATIPEGNVTVAGWVDKVRDQKKVQFVVLRDESGAAQLVHPRAEESDPIADIISGLATGSFIRVTGELKLDERVKLGGLEIKIADIQVVTAANPETPIAADSSIDKRLDWRFLDLREARNNLIFRARPPLSTRCVTTGLSATSLSSTPPS